MKNPKRQVQEDSQLAKALLDKIKTIGDFSKLSQKFNVYSLFKSDYKRGLTSHL